MHMLNTGEMCAFSPFSVDLFYYTLFIVHSPIKYFRLFYEQLKYSYKNSHIHTHTIVNCQLIFHSAWYVYVVTVKIPPATTLSHSIRNFWTQFESDKINEPNIFSSHSKKAVSNFFYFRMCLIHVNVEMWTKFEILKMKWFFFHSRPRISVSISLFLCLKYNTSFRSFEQNAIGTLNISICWLLIEELWMAGLFLFCSDLFFQKCHFVCFAVRGPLPPSPFSLSLLIFNEKMIVFHVIHIRIRFGLMAYSNCI